VPGWVEPEAFDSLRARLGATYSDSTLASALAFLFRGRRTGFNDDIAFIAAGLYTAWTLPIAAALSVLVDHTATSTTRLAALRAIWHERTSPAARVGLAVTLCDIDATVAGVLSRWRGPPPAHLARILDDATLDLLEYATRAAVDARLRGAWEPLAPLLPANSLVRRYIGAREQPN
jgi:hypothetical protein